MNRIGCFAIAGALAMSVMGLTVSARAEDPPSPPREPATPTVSELVRPKEPAKPPVASSSGSRSAWGPTIALLLVAGLGGAAFYMTKMKRRGLTGTTRHGTLNVLDTARVGERAYLVTAHVGDRVMLLGVSEAGIRRLAWLKPDNAAATAPDAEMNVTLPARPEREAHLDIPIDREEKPARAAQAPALGGFADALRGILATRGTRPDASTVRDEIVDEPEPARSAAPSSRRRDPPPREDDEMDSEGSPAEVLAARTRDVVERRASRAPQRAAREPKADTRVEPRSGTRVSQPPTAAASTSDEATQAAGIEGQVTGLRRRNGRQPR